MREPDDSMHIALSPTPEAPRAARRALESFAAQMPEAVRQDASLLVSELVTNSVVHASPAAGASIEVAAERRNGTLRVEVLDQGLGIVDALRGARSTPRRSGYGLLLMDRLADRWGLQRDRRTGVWFEIASDGR